MEDLKSLRSKEVENLERLNQEHSEAQEVYLNEWKILGTSSPDQINEAWHKILCSRARIDAYEISLNAVIKEMSQEGILR